jgi:iron complex transport system substrate-binding protein
MKTQHVYGRRLVALPLHFCKGVFIYLKGMSMKSFLRVILLSVAVILSACATAPAQAPTATSVPEATMAATVAPTIAPTTAPTAVAVASVTDSAGRVVAIPTSVSKIISLAPSTTEMIYALGKGSAVVAIDMYSDYPPEVSSVAKISNPDMTYNYEQIAALAPDMVFAAGITSPDVITAIEKLNIPVVVVGSVNTTFASIKSDITLVGTLLGATSEATTLTTQMQVDWDALVAKAANIDSKPRVFWELDATDPSKPYTIGAGGFVNELLVAAGGINVFGDVENPYPQVSVEQVVAAAPDIIILADSLYGVTPDMVANRAGWEGIPAVKNQSVFPIDDNLVSRPGPRIVAGLAAVIAIIEEVLVEVKY